MSEFSRTLQLRWSDLDPNFHVRHSVYYDWGAFCRVEFLNEHGLDAAMMEKLKFGPILFREECVFRREIKSGDNVRITLSLIRSRKDFSRWSFEHKLIKEDGTLCAIITVDGAWMDIVKRKLATPPETITEIFEAIDKNENFEWI